MDDILCVGDIVNLFSAESYGYVFAHQTSSVHNEIAVASNQNKQRPDFQDSQVLSFEVQVANRYKLYEKYIKLLDTLSKDPDNISLRNKVAKAKQAADLEREGNELIQDRQMGKKLQYGQIIQLRHLFTNKYIHVSTTNTSVTESNNMSVELKTENAIHAQYKVMPRYKVKAEGDLVQVDDQIVLESMRSPGSFLHVSKSQFGGTNVYAHSHEMNLSVQQSGFTVFRKYKPSETDVDKVKAGTIIRLFHREMEAYLVAEGLFNDQILEDVHLRMRPMDQENPKTMLPSTNPVTYWQIELSDGPTHGGCLKWEQQCKLIHLCSRKYLCIDKSGRVTLSADNNDPHTVFRLHPVIRENDYVLLETYCRIEHVVSGLWLHALNDEYQEKRLMGSDDPNSIASLGWSRAKLRQIGTMTEKQYDDAFTMQEVTPDLVEVFNFIAGMCPFIQKLIEDKKNGKNLDPVITEDILIALQEMCTYMVVDSFPDKGRQKLLRSLTIVDLMVVILRMPFRGTPDQGHMTEIMVKAYEVLGTYLLGGSRKNELYIARYIDFFMSQFEYREGAIGLNAAHMVMELVRDNRQIKDRITHAHIDTFVDLLQRNKNYRYLDLLSVLCANDGVTIANNQSYITEKWLKSDNNKCVFHTSLGQEINLTHDLVYVSTNQRKTWTELSEFAQDQQGEDYLFLVHQLELFGELCKGQNEFCIQVITEELNYLTWEEAFVCLTNEILPDDLRSKYCHLIVTMFVDIKDNHSVIDRIKLTYIYDSIDELEDELDLSQSRTYEYFPTLSKWMSEYLGRNSDMTASEIGSNMLIKQVLRLLQYLVSFGFYNKSIHFKLLLGPLMNLVDGRHDNPYPNIPAGREGDEIERRYREVDRYKRSIETTHVVNAKAQACHTLNLFLNLRENFRMERFMYLYKKTHMQANSNKFPKAELGVCLREDFDFNEHIGTKDGYKVAKRAVNRLKEIFESTSFLRDFGLVDVLKDLSQYEYDELIRVSMHLMNRNFSGLGKLISRALQAQVIITEKSVQICKRLEVLIPRLRHFTTTELNEEQAKEVTGILDQMIEMCYLDNEPSEEHGMNQSILYNHGVLDDIFTIFKQSVDVKLMEKYVGLRRTFQRSFILLKNMAKNNKMIQGRLCDRLDLLLAKDGAWEELAECLTEIFTGNADTCMKVTTKQIHKIVIVISKNKANIPQLFEPLNAIMKIEELDVPLKRNQGYVMQYFMQYRSEIAYVIDQDEKEREKILLPPYNKDLQYLICMVDMLACCAEGESRYIESICQTMIKIPDILNILNNAEISFNLKRPFLRYLQWVYLNTAGGMYESGTADLPHDKLVWKYIGTIDQTVKEATGHMRANPNIVQRLLKKAPTKGEVPKGEEEIARGRLHYLFDGCMEFLQTFVRQYYQEDVALYPEEPKILDNLTHSFKDFLEAVTPLINILGQSKLVISTMTSLIPASTLPNSYIKEFQESYKNFDGSNIRSDARKAYDDYFGQELEMNRELNTFALNIQYANEGVNKLENEGNFDPEQELPSGQEFLDHLKCFIDNSKTDPKLRYRLSEKLVKQLIISTGLTHLSETEREEQEELDIRCLQLIRGLIQLEINNLPEDWEGNPNREVRKQLSIIEGVQNALDKNNVVTSVLDHLNRPQDEVVRETLLCMASLLFNGNNNIQMSFINYFYGTREEKFFFTVKKRMDMAASAISERRMLQAMHQAKMEEAMQQVKSLNRMQNGAPPEMNDNNPKSKALSRAASSTMLAGPKGGLTNGAIPSINGSMMSIARTAKVEPEKPDPKKNKQLVDDQEIKLDVSLESPSDLEFKDEYNIETLLLCLGLLCDNQCAEIQNYLREQPDNIKSANLVAEVTKFMNILFTNINEKSLPLVVQLFDTLVEFTSGNVMNRANVFENKICDYINFILRLEQIQGCTREEEYVLKKAIATLIKSLTEENPPEELDGDEADGKAKSNDGFSVKEVMQYLDTDLIVTTMVESYKDMLVQEKKGTDDENYQLVMDTGFSYYQLMKRKMDLDDTLQVKNLIKTPEQKQAWAYYEQSTLSIEILKDNVLQKLYFKVKDKKVLREEVKDIFNYAVDRTSPSNKIRDFMDWSSDIMKDIKYQQTVHNSIIGRTLVKLWIPMNYAVLFLSIVISVFITVVWRDPKNADLTSDINSFKPEYTIDEDLYQYLLYGVGGIHNFLCLCVLITFFLSNQPSFPPYRWLKTKLLPKDKGEDLRTWHEKMDSSNLEVQIYSFKTLYYFVFLGCSGMGTYWYGYFFAFHLLHIAVLNQLLKRVIEAVTTNGKSLILVTLLGLAIFFCYALVAFAFFRERFLKEESGRHCRTLGQCLITIIHHGVVESPYTSLEGDMSVDYGDVIQITMFDVTFFILVTTIGLNIIFGIIVDTFSQLRDSKWEIDKDMQRRCFICSRESYDFERHGGGFLKHVREEHNQWAYLFFFIHLDETRPNDYTALELYVFNKLQTNTYDFFPLNKALCLLNEEDSQEQRMENMEMKLDYVMNTMKRQAADKEKVREKRRQQEWEAKHKNSKGNGDDQ